MDAAVIEDFVDHLVSFRALGGAIHRVAGQSGQREGWTAEAFAYLDGLVQDDNSGDPELKPSRRQMAGAVFMHGALDESPECFVALCNGVVVGALGFVVKGDHLGGTKLGTRQAIRGTAFELSLALAREASDRGLPVLGVYTGPDARSFHTRIGRRLDGRGRGSSEWLVEDCSYIIDCLEGRI